MRHGTRAHGRPFGATRRQARRHTGTVGYDHPRDVAHGTGHVSSPRPPYGPTTHGASPPTRRGHLALRATRAGATTFGRRDDTSARRGTAARHPRRAAHRAGWGSSPRPLRGPVAAAVGADPQPRAARSRWHATAPLAACPARTVRRRARDTTRAHVARCRGPSTPDTIGTTPPGPTPRHHQPAGGPGPGSPAPRGRSGTPRPPSPRAPHGPCDAAYGTPLGHTSHAAGAPAPRTPSRPHHRGRRPGTTSQRVVLVPAAPRRAVAVARRGPPRRVPRTDRATPRTGHHSGTRRTLPGPQHPGHHRGHTTRAGRRPGSVRRRVVVIPATPGRDHDPCGSQGSWGRSRSGE
ncbi:hypothetical protein Strvi_3777 [Streptomyces violaceusniger Tu 4113]|uniref:Uncharacterized protein n=1 Tax=Streptomyces violaceusniger (strain Tu 4113) TaxID=653045 RepID=G2NZH0_STRV4|nr:hypothetical protein Strvi_3777 [Streptomyces violaceusniger Tu 4113]